MNVCLFVLLQHVTCGTWALWSWSLWRDSRRFRRRPPLRSPRTLRQHPLSSILKCRHRGSRSLTTKGSECSHMSKHVQIQIWIHMLIQTVSVPAGCSSGDTTLSTPSSSVLSTHRAGSEYHGFISMNWNKTIVIIHIYSHRKHQKEHVSTEATQST